MEKIKATAPGKLMLAGEWAVLELGNPCIVMGVDKGVTVTVSSSEVIEVEAPDIDLKASGILDSSIFIPSSMSKEKKEKFVFVRHAIDVALQYLHEHDITLSPFRILIESDISGSNGAKKLGLGSSAAVVVAVIKGIFKFHNRDNSSPDAKEIVFKLSSIAHYRAQNNMGSCFDIAAATYGGTVLYKRFNPAWLVGQLRAKKLGPLVSQLWPFLEVRQIVFPRALGVRSEFSGYSSNTRDLIERMQDFKTQNKTKYDSILRAIGKIVEKLAISIEQENIEEILSLIKQNRERLQELSEESGLFLETPELKRICDEAQHQGCAAKFSGAGGGDCAIIVFKVV